MNWLKGVAAAAALLAFASARAEDLTVHEHRSPVGAIAADTIYGGLAGAAVGGGIILYQMEINNNHGYDWGRTLAISTGVGLAAGLVFGIVDVASSPTYDRVPVTDGLSFQELHPRDQSGAVTMPLRTLRW